MTEPGISQLIRSIPACASATLELSESSAQPGVFVATKHIAILGQGIAATITEERLTGAAVPSVREYYHLYGLTREKLALAKADAIVMHPGPMNRGVEIDGTLADDINRSVIQDQVEMGVAVRMAAMDLLAQNLTQSRAEGAA